MTFEKRLAQEQERLKQQDIERDLNLANRPPVYDTGVVGGRLNDETGAWEPILAALIARNKIKTMEYLINVQPMQPMSGLIFTMKDRYTR